MFCCFRSSLRMFSKEFFFNCIFLNPVLKMNFPGYYTLVQSHTMVSLYSLILKSPGTPWTSNLVQARPLDELTTVQWTSNLVQVRPADELTTVQ